MSGDGEIRLVAPAKINLALHITGLRKDGYHLLETVAVFTEFGDRLSLKPAVEDRLFVTGPYSATIPSGPDNIILRALALYRDITGSLTPRVSIALEKNLPAAAGIGGGSSDAAAFLKAFDRMCSSTAGYEGLHAIGHRLGADLPMCLQASPLIAKGIGEQIEPLDQFPRLALVLVNPGVEIPTPAVFKALGANRNPPLPQLNAGLTPRAVAEWLMATRNDLEAPAKILFPKIEEARYRLEETSASFVRMSGSGATFFGIFSDLEAARNAAETIAMKRPDWFVVATETLASGDIHEPDR